MQSKWQLLADLLGWNVRHIQHGWMGQPENEIGVFKTHHGHCVIKSQDRDDILRAILKA